MGICVGLGVLVEYGEGNSEKLKGYFMKLDKKYKLMIVILAGLFMLSCCALYYVAVVKTDFSKRMMAKINHKPYVPERRDADCVASLTEDRLLEIILSVKGIGKNRAEQVIAKILQEGVSDGIET